MLETTTLGTITCYAIIIAMAVIIFKTISYPLNNFINSINPFLRHRQIRQMLDRINDLEMNKFMYDQEINELKKEIKSIKAQKK
jgi:sensor histidine kinase YesM